MRKSYRDLSLEEFAMLTSIAEERHRAFNWLCGLSLWSVGKHTDRNIDSSQ
jgi:hypothetical protein